MSDTENSAHSDHQRTPEKLTLSNVAFEISGFQFAVVNNARKPNPTCPLNILRMSFYSPFNYVIDGVEYEFHSFMQAFHAAKANFCGDDEFFENIVEYKIVSVVEGKNRYDFNEANEMMAYIWKNTRSMKNYNHDDWCREMQNVAEGILISIFSSRPDLFRHFKVVDEKWHFFAYIPNDKYLGIGNGDETKKYSTDADIIKDILNFTGHNFFGEAVSSAIRHIKESHAKKERDTVKDHLRTLSIAASNLIEITKQRNNFSLSDKQSINNILSVVTAIKNNMDDESVREARTPKKPASEYTPAKRTSRAQTDQSPAVKKPSERRTSEKKASAKSRLVNGIANFDRVNDDSDGEYIGDDGDHDSIKE